MFTERDKRDLTIFYTVALSLLTFGFGLLSSWYMPVEFNIVLSIVAGGLLFVTLPWLEMMVVVIFFVILSLPPGKMRWLRKMLDPS